MAAAVVDVAPRQAASPISEPVDLEAHRWTGGMYECTVPPPPMPIPRAQSQADDERAELVRGERASLSILLSTGVGLLWFLGWLLTL